MRDRERFKDNAGLVKLFRKHILELVERNGFDKQALDFDGYLDLEGTWNENLQTFEREYGLWTNNGPSVDQTWSKDEINEAWAAYQTNRIFSPIENSICTSPSISDSRETEPSDSRLIKNPISMSRTRFKSNPPGIWEPTWNPAPEHEWSTIQTPLVKPPPVPDYPTFIISNVSSPQRTISKPVNRIKPDNHLNSNQQKRHSWLRSLLEGADMLLSSGGHMPSLNYTAMSLLRDLDKPKPNSTGTMPPKAPQPSQDAPQREIIMQVGKDAYVGPFSSSKPCELCGKTILWHNDGKTWFRLDPNGTRHGC